MSDAKERIRVASEMQAREREELRPRGTRFIFKLLGLVLVVAAGWVGWYAYRQGSLPDLRDPKQQEKAISQMREDLELAKEKAKVASEVAKEWASRGYDKLQELMKSKPPETKEEISQLVKESKDETQKIADAQPQKKAQPSTVPEPHGPFQDALDEYRKGQAAYALTDPSAPQIQVQSNLKLAAPHFSRALDMLEKARKEGMSGPEVDRLEQAAARRLYDCRKRIELNER